MKEQLIELYKKAELEHPVGIFAIDFLETYDGTNEEELQQLFGFLLMALQEAEIANIKAESYDVIEEARGDLNVQLNKIKSDMKHLEAGNLPPMPMESTGVDESEVTE